MPKSKEGNNAFNQMRRWDTQNLCGVRGQNKTDMVEKYGKGG